MKIDTTTEYAKIIVLNIKINNDADIDKNEINIKCLQLNLK